MEAPASDTAAAALGRFGPGLRSLAWIGYALVLLTAPLLFSSSLALTMLTQMGYLIVILLSYNLLLGQGGMLSFGHAVYVGLGSFFVVHALNLAGAGRLPIPVTLMPLVGGLAGMAVAALLGWVTTRKAATPFAMITLGVGELVFSMSLMFPGFFGGEGGISTNRVIGAPVLGISYGPQIQVYYLVAAYCLVSTAALYALTLTPLGRLLNAVRDNPERVAFIGYNPQVVRYIAFIFAGFFAGIGGALQALNFESATAEALSGLRSGSYLLFTFLGGSLYFFGPIIGGVLLVLAVVMFSGITKAWQIYLGLGFMLMVMFAPGGIASLVMANLRVASFGRLRGLLLPYAALLAAGALALAGGAALIEMIYHLQLDAAMGRDIGVLGLRLDTGAPAHWVGVLALLSVGGVLFEAARRRFARAWGSVQQAIRQQIRTGEAR